MFRPSGRPTTAEAAARARTASGLGAAAVVVTTPYGPDVTQDEPELCKALLTDRGEERAAELRAACARYRLERDNWYRSLKTELVRHAVIETDREVPC